MIFHDYIKPSNNSFSSEKHDELLTDLIKTMREDLFLSSKINKDYPIIHLTGKNRTKNKYGRKQQKRLKICVRFQQLIATN